MDSSILDRESNSALSQNSLDRIFLFLVSTAIAFVPFQVALTINLAGNPLKISEIFFAVSIALFPFTSYPKNKIYGKYLILIFLLLLIVSSAYNLTTQGIEIYGTLRGFNLDPSQDLLFYFIFGIFSLLCWRIVASLGEEKISRALVYSAYSCTAAVLFQFVFVYLGMPTIVEILGFESSGRLEGGLVSTRNGPFQEGQHLGFYAGFVLLISIYRKSWLASLGMIFCIYYSYSTTAILGLCAALGILIIFRLNLLTASISTFVSIVVLISYVAIKQVRDFLNLQLAKLGITGLSSEPINITQSLEIRSLKTDIAWNIMFNNPLLGVGPGRYSIWFFKDPLADSIDKYYFNSDHRAIAENVYAHVGSELGLIALSVLVLLLIVIAYKGLKNKSLIVLSSLGFIVLGISTQSTWTFLPIWVFLGFLCSAETTQKFNEGMK